VFIRAPRIMSPGPEAEILSMADGDIVALRQDNILISTFHPELTDDLFFLSLFTDLVRKVTVRPAHQNFSEP
ncbi:hypothetical protein EG833_02385, partial [archaeon]|nr:hypothetical protein [archaeon]